MAYKKNPQERRQKRVRRQIKAVANGRPRLSVYRRLLMMRTATPLLQHRHSTSKTVATLMPLVLLAN